MIYQSTVDATELCNNLYNKKAPSWQCARNVLKIIICRSFFTPESFILRYKYLLGIPSLCYSLLITILHKLISRALPHDLLIQTKAEREATPFIVRMRV